MKESIDSLSEKDAAAVVAGMQEVQAKGLAAARHLRGEIYEIRIDGVQVIYRLLFAPQGRQSQVLLTLLVLKKKTQKTPPRAIRLAQSRLTDWKARGRKKKAVYI
ncbi:MAG: type II toxin-antitoxin system RelE/ParE family toxin [Solirubrobacterales bacterium]